MSDQQTLTDFQRAARRGLIAVFTLFVSVLVLMTPFAVAALPAEEFNDQKLADQYWDAADAGNKQRQLQLYDEIHLLGGHIDEDCGGCDWPSTENTYRLGVYRIRSFFVD